MPLLTFSFCAPTGLAYANNISYAELSLACAHQSFACATPSQGAPYQNINRRVLNRFERDSNGHKVPGGKS